MRVKQQKFEMGLLSMPISNFYCFTLYHFFSTTLPDQKNLISDWTRTVSFLSKIFTVVVCP